MTFIDLQKAEEEARKAKEEEEKRKKKEEERARRRARGLEDEEEQEEEEKKEGEGDEEEQKEGEETEEEQHREPGEIIKGFYYGKKDKFWVSMVGLFSRMFVQCTATGAYNQECATPILSLCNDVFTGQDICSIIFEHFSSRKWKHRSIMRAYP